MSALTFYQKAVASFFGCALFLSGTQAATAAALNISNIPLILNDTVAPNLILTLDDSGSMRFAFAPDRIGMESSGWRNTRRAKSSTFNPMYYNPAVTYQVPTKTNDDGSEASPGYSTSFTSAYQNGFKTSAGTVNLSDDYKVSWDYDISQEQSYTYSSSTNYSGSGTIYRLAENPASDFINLTGSRESFSNERECTFNGYYTFSCESYRSSGRTRYRGERQSVSSNDTQKGVPAYYYVFNTSLPNCVSESEEDDECYELITVSASSGIDGTDERENFAIWYSFYRNRALATLSATNIAFNNLSSSVRFNWQSLNSCKSLTEGACDKNLLREFNTQHKGNFFNWLTDIQFDSGTPLREALGRAGEFLKRDEAWAKTPNPFTSSGGKGTTVQSPQYSCRPSYHVLMTDGMWNGNNASPSNLKPDHSSVNLPDGKNYSGTRHPYVSDHTNTLADLAMHYWATDLNSNLANNLKPYVRAANTDATIQYWDPKNDPADWQHMVNYTMGLGLTESLTLSGLEWDQDEGTFGGNGYNNLVSGAKSWPKPEADSANNIYDLWHTAINSRGEFFSVDSPEAMVEAFQEILNRISDRTTTAARPAVSASFVSDADGAELQSNIYATQFSSEDWSGEMVRTSVDASGTQTELWSSKERNQSTLDVSINSGSTEGSGLENFDWNNLSDEQKVLFNKNPESLNNSSDGRGEERVAYIQGSRANEGSGDEHFRKRSTVIGDIINSSPVIVGTPSYLAYLADQIENPISADAPQGRAGYQGYADFRQTHKKITEANPDGRKEMLYVGANDGMLHGFNASTGKADFSFIPSEVMPNLYRLTGKNYAGGEHRFFVDGSPIVRDVYFSDADGWRTVLVGTLRAGGKALFALDITDPTNIKLLWEFDATAENGDVDLGYTFAQPEIVRLHSGQWAVLMGNGYNSTNDKAALLIIDIQTGDLLKKLELPEVVENGTSLPNGLSSVRAADNNGDGIADYAYAGDLQGNLWRFDLIKPVNTDGTMSGDPFSRNRQVNVSTDDFKTSYNETPLFTARDDENEIEARQPITIQPSLVRHPTRYGYLVLFGTGKYFENNDANVDTSRAMTIYGIWDRQTRAQPTTEATARAEERSNLASQTFGTQNDGALVGLEGNQATNDIRILSDDMISWFKPDTTDLQDDGNVAEWGWQLNLQVGSAKLGEMVINNMSASGRTLFYSSLTPNLDPCSDGADTWFYAIDAYTGGRTAYNVLDLSKDGIVDGVDKYTDKVISGVRFPALGGFNLAPGNKVYGSDGANDPATVGDDPNSSGRQSWHIIPEEFQ